MKHRFLILFLILVSFRGFSQVNGSDTVCAGYLYTFDAVVAGADSFVWSYPSGWAVISGANTSQIQLLCTQNVGQVCVDAYDNGNFQGQFCHTVNWGDGGVGWNVQVTSATLCQCPPQIASVIPNGTGSGCAGCGNGLLSPNIQFAIYDNLWPSGNYIGPADGVFQFPLPLFNTTYYVYQVDITFGINNAILIEGGLCAGIANNSFSLTGPCMYVNLPIYTIPSQICVGDTILCYTDNSMGNYGPYNWFFLQGNATLLQAGSSDSVYCIINGTGTLELNMLGYFGACPIAGDIFLNPQVCSQSIIGDSTVCAGYTYNYSVTMPGAVNYVWTLPIGWYSLTGQGTSSISAICNVNAGDICVEGFDANSNSVGTQCITTHWGNGGGAGWDVVPSSTWTCANATADWAFTIVPNLTGGGSCPPGCGNGTMNPNLIYGLYDAALNFIGEVNGLPIQIPPVIATYHVYYVDVTLGYDFPDAINITGGCGNAVINNQVENIVYSPQPPMFTQVPDPACIGDTVLVTQVNPMITNSAPWSDVAGTTIYSNPSPEEVIIGVFITNAQIQYYGTDFRGCSTTGICTVNVLNCLPPQALFNTSSTFICPGTCINFNNFSTGATSYEWFFPGADSSSSTLYAPSNICYANPGSYDVTLIAANAYGTDTVMMANYITVYPTPPPQNIIVSSDTLFANAGFASYQWYYNSNIIPGATDLFYVPTLNGDYTTISLDSNGCESSYTLTGFVMIPIAGFTAVTNPICPGTCTGFTNLSTGATFYEWSFTGANPSSSTDVNPSNICYNLPGVYDVQLIATNSAGSDTLLLTNYITVLPYPPLLSINQVGDSLFSSQGFLSYQWYHNGNLIAGATDYFYVALLNGDYNLIATDSNLCEVEAAIFNVVTGLSPNLSNGGGKLILYPDPVKKELFVSVPIAANAEIKIINLLGESVQKMSTNISERFTIDVQSLSRGIYILEISDDLHSYRAKFVKE